MASYINNTLVKSFGSVICVIFTMLMMSRLIGGIASPSYVLVNALILAYLLFFIIKGVSIYKPFLVFFSYIVLSLFLSKPDPIFHSWERFLIFFILLLLISPFLQNPQLRRFRQQSFYIMIGISIIVACLSFLFYFLGINLMEVELTDISFHDKAGTFGGLTKHSMLLGPLCGVSIISLVYFYYVEKKRIIILLIIPCSGCLFFAASRGSIIATAIGLIVVLYNLSKSKTFFLKRLVGIFFIMILTYPLWDSVTSGVQQKLEREDLGVFDSRTSKVEARIEEFKQSPVWGVGFSAIDPNGTDNYNKITGTIEPGSSWLAVISMLGIIGFLIVVYIICVCFSIFYSLDFSELGLLVGLFSFFGVHMIIEGYIFAAGSPLCYMFWLIVGVSTDLKFSTIVPRSI